MSEHHRLRTVNLKSSTIYTVSYLMAVMFYYLQRSDMSCAASMVMNVEYILQYLLSLLSTFKPP